MGNLIAKENALIEANHRLGEVEQRLVLLAILKACNVGDTVEQLKDKMLTMHADDCIANFGGTHQRAYKALKQAVMGLYRTEWRYKYLEKGGQRVRYERFTQSAYFQNYQNKTNSWSYTRLHNEQYDPALQRIHEKHYNSWTKRSKFFMNLAIKFRRWSKSGDLLNPNHRVDVGCETMKEVKECQ